MENIVNLETLNTRDELIKEYIDDKTSSVSSTMLFCELEIYKNNNTKVNKLYLKCYKGDILDTDTLQFARNKSVVTQWDYSEPNKPKPVKKRQGWIIPHTANLVRLYKVYDVTKSSESNIYDYWEILPKDKNNNPITWQQLLDEFLTHRHNNNIDSYNGQFSDNYACFINKWCGVAIVRDNKLISSYKRWKMSGPSKSGPSYKYPPLKSSGFYSPYAVNGTYCGDHYNGNRNYCFEI